MKALMVAEPQWQEKTLLDATTVNYDHDGTRKISMIFNGYQCMIMTAISIVT